MSLRGAFITLVWLACVACAEDASEPPPARNREALGDIGERAPWAGPFCGDPWKQRRDLLDWACSFPYEAVTFFYFEDPRLATLVGYINSLPNFDPTRGDEGSPRQEWWLQVVVVYRGVETGHRRYAAMTFPASHTRVVDGLAYGYVPSEHSARTYWDTEWISLETIEIATKDPWGRGLTDFTIPADARTVLFRGPAYAAE